MKKLKIDINESMTNKEKSKGGVIIKKICQFKNYSIFI
jgi:hypothetical protein